MNRAETPIVVGGCHRSGTSMVRRILDLHPEIHCGPEVAFFRDFHDDYFSDPLRHLRFTSTACDLVGEEEALDVLGHAFVELHGRAASLAGKRRWADKAPENVLYTRQWERLLGGDWIMVQLVRDPVDTIASMLEAGFPLTLPPDLQGRIDFYRRYTEAGFAFGKVAPDRYRRIVYEDLCRNPETVVRDLMAWLGEDFDDRQLDFGRVSRLPGLEDPKVAATDAVHTRSIDRGAEMLSKDEIAAIRAQTADLWPRAGRGTP
jgi:hypothetical protein